MLGHQLTENGNDLSTTIDTIESQIKQVLPKSSDRVYVTNARKHDNPNDRYCWMLDHFQLEFIKKSKYNKERMVLSFDPFFLEINGQERSIEDCNILLYKWKEALDDIERKKAKAFIHRGD